MPKSLLFTAGFVLSMTIPTLAVPVTFRVDMTGAMGFNPIFDLVDVRGSFNGWNAGSNLVPSADPNILTNTFDVADAPGTVEYYKFTWNFNWELPNMGNRPFTLTGDPQILPLVYFSDQPPALSATTNAITFRISMATQATLGNFDPNTDTVWAAGTFQSPTQWTPQMFQLTNSGANNLFVGTYTNDGNYEGTYEEFKFIYRRFDNDNWESINNRSFILTNGGVLPIVYFNDVGNAVPVTFQVDMSAPAAAGRFTSGSDLVECKGSFNAGFGGFVLTNDPGASNPNLFSGTTYIFDSPGTTELYKFAVNGGFSGLGWEAPVTTGGGNRTFTQPASALTLPPVLWSDWTPADLLAANTVVTFRVNMTNAVGTDGHPFDDQVDAVYLNGDWIPWWGWNPFQPDTYKLTNNPVGSKIYSLEVTLPQGYSVPLCYKYSINAYDNEADFGANHYRFVRAVGNYQLPLDTFGSQVLEASFGNLVIAPAPAGSVVLSWLGRPGVHLQTTTNLTSPIIWQERLDTDGLNATNYPKSAPRTFFRLVKP